MMGFRLRPSPTMRILVKPLALAALAAGLSFAAAPPAEAARVGIGIGIGLPIGGYYAPPYYGPGYWGPGYWGPNYYYGPRYVVAPPVVVDPPAQALPQAPEPIFYPKNGQSAAQTETDRQECNRWATSQSNALADAGVFQRATYACMEGRGYTVK